MKSGSELIAEERARQISMDGWTPEHDDSYSGPALLAAARCYACAAHEQASGMVLISHQHGYPTIEWPWRAEWWKPSTDPVRNLVKAGSLIAAEIDRLQRVVNGSDQPPARG